MKALKEQTLKRFLFLLFLLLFPLMTNGQLLASGTSKKAQIDDRREMGTNQLYNSDKPLNKNKLVSIERLERGIT